jgi:hypothetical protein
MIIRSSDILASLKRLNEEYFEMYKSRLGDPYPVFKNPSYREMFRELGPSVRFSADDQTKTVYAWNADAELHPFFRKSARLSCPERNKFMFWCDLILEGVAAAHGGKYIMFISDGLEGRVAIARGIDDKQIFAKKVLMRDWSWVDRYIEVSPYLNQLRKKLGFSGYDNFG